MPEPLYKYLGRRSAKVIKTGDAARNYENQNPQYKKSVAMASDDYEIGIEIEIENIRHHIPADYFIWEVKNDGSLRNNGYEYVSIPICGWRIPYAIHQFFGTVDQEYHFSPRTSIHVHLNALDMTPYQITGLILTYLAFEPLLYRFIGQDRDRNNFCVPLMDSNAHIITYFTNDIFVPPQLSQHRYLGLNLDAVRKFGTVEFRHLGGTDDKEKILSWINLIFCLKKHAMAYDYRQIVNRVTELNSNSAYHAYFQEVFGSWGVVLDTSQLQKDMEWPVSRIKSLGLTNDWFRELTRTVKINDVWYQKLVTSKQKKVETDYFMFGAENVQPAAPVRARAVPVENADGLDALAQRLRVERERERLRELYGPAFFRLDQAAAGLAVPAPAPAGDIWQDNPYEDDGPMFDDEDGENP